MFFPISEFTSACAKQCIYAIVLLGLLASPATYAAEIVKPIGTFSSAGATSSTIYQNPNLRGIRTNWSTIETAPGSFNFTSITNQVNVAKSNGKGWSLAISGGGVGSPSWLTDTTSDGLSAPYITYSFRSVPGYKLPLFWNSDVRNEPLTLTVELSLNGQNYTAQSHVKFSGKAGFGGTFK